MQINIQPRLLGVCWFIGSTAVLLRTTGAFLSDSCNILLTYALTNARLLVKSGHAVCLVVEQVAFHTLHCCCCCCCFCEELFGALHQKLVINVLVCMEIPVLPYFCTVSVIYRHHICLFPSRWTTDLNTTEESKSAISFSIIYTRHISWVHIDMVL